MGATKKNIKKTSMTTEQEEPVEIPQAFVELIKENAEGTSLHYGEGENSIVIKVRQVVPVKDYLAMVYSIADMVFVGDGNDINDYTPGYLDFSRRYNFLKTYTDIQFPSNLEAAWLIVNHTPIFDDVAEYIGEPTIAQIFRQADSLIRARVEYLSHKTDINRFIDKMLKSTNDLPKELGEVDLKDVLGVLKNLQNATPEAIVDAVVKASKDTSGEIT